MLFHLHAVFLVIKCGDVRNINKMPHALISHIFMTYQLGIYRAGIFYLSNLESVWLYK